MKFKSEVLTQASGSIGGTTYAHNRGGLYRRARSIPTNPNSSAQQAARMAFAYCSTEWGNQLSTFQRQAWEDYAAATPTTDRLGDELILTGQQMFVKSNQPRKQALGAIQLMAPIIPGFTTFTPCTATIVDGDLSIAYTNTDDWAANDGGFLFIQTSRPVAPTINFFKGPFRYLANVPGNGTTPPTSPYTNTEDAFGNGFDQNIGAKYFIRLTAYDQDGRPSTAQILSALSTES